MTTSKEETSKPLTLNRPSRLELKKTIETGQVRQSFSHGRSKAVVVEVKRSRTFAPGAGGRMTEVMTPRATAEAALAEATVPKAPAHPTAETESPRELTEAERAVRIRALESAQLEEEHRKVEEALVAEQLAKQQAETDRQSVEQAKLDSAAAEAAAPPAEAIEAPAGKQAAERTTPEAKRKAEDEASGKARHRRPTSAPKQTPSRRNEPRRREGKLTISQALDGGKLERVRSLASVRRQRERQRTAEKQVHQPPSRVIREVVVPEAITVQELANRMAERGSEVVKALMKMGVMATINQTIDADAAELLVGEFGHKMKRVADTDVEEGLVGAPDDEGDLQPRAPVVTIMGHVDHGKTSLLDALRQTDVAAHEAGGITQHIGAYQITLGSGSKITFIDTPGHAAFTEMRMRGASVTDIVVLVVAADDGIKEQTVEAINHAKAAKVPIIVAINKMDRPEASVDKIQNELLQHELVPEAMGGEVLCVPVSAKEKTNLDKLEETIVLQAELMELKANPDRSAEAVVVEAKVERGRGSVATVLVKRGTLRLGDLFVVGSEWGRVRALINDRGEDVKESGPSEPVEVLGLTGTPMAGDDFVVVDSESRARSIAEFRGHQKREKDIVAQNRGTLEQMMTRIKEGEVKGLPVVVKSDVHGSLEAIVGSLEKLGNEEVRVNVMHAGVGGINESDVTLASASGGLIIAFNVRANPQAREMARRDNVDVRYYSIIYNLVDDLKAALTGMLSPKHVEKFLGYAEIREVFSITKVGKVAGCMVTEGQVRRGAKVRLLRDDIVIHDGTLKTLRRFKEETKEVKDGYECGMAFENYQDIQTGDRIECYEVEQIAQQL